MYSFEWKSFLLKPIELIFKTFRNPATGKYAFVGVDEKEVLFLNDFRYSSEIIAWSEFLLLLEGDTVHLPRPKNMYATDGYPQNLDPQYGPPIWTPNMDPNLDPLMDPIMDP